LLSVYFPYFLPVLHSPAVLLFHGKNSTSRLDVSQLLPWSCSWSQFLRRISSAKSRTCFVYMRQGL
jgi:hypothetical protein